MLHSVKHGYRQLIVVGDRVLIKPELADERSEFGLILPQTVVEKEKVHFGKVVAVGPGIPVPEISTDAEDEPWKPSERKPRYIPMQAGEGDYALFLKKAGFEIKFDGDEYLVVPHSAILVLLRDAGGAATPA